MEELQGHFRPEFLKEGENVFFPLSFNLFAADFLRI